MNHVISAATMYPFCGLGLTFTGGGGWRVTLGFKPSKTCTKEQEQTDPFFVLIKPFIIQRILVISYHGLM